MENHLTKDQIFDYLKDQLHDLERNRVERHLLDCEFCQEAMDGLESLDNELVAGDLLELEARLEKRIPSKNRTLRPYFVAAAAVLIVMVASIVFLQIEGLDSNDDQVAMESKVQPEQEDNTAEKAIQQESTQEESQKSGPIAEEGQNLKPSAESAERIEPVQKNGSSKRENFKKDYSTAKTKSKPIDNQIIESKSEQLIAQVEVEEDDQLGEMDMAGNAGAKNDPLISSSPLPQMTRAKIIADQSFVESEEAVTTSVGFADISNRSVRGHVYSSGDREALPGVTVVVKGTTQGTTTDIEGYFDLNLEQDTARLVFMFVGMEAIEVDYVVGENKDVEMIADTQALSEVVVTGVARRKSMNYSSSEVVDSPVIIDPKPILSRKDYKAYIKNNLEYPDEAKQLKIRGKVKIQFMVRSTGELSGFHVVRGIGHGCDDEAIRLIQEGPAWQPATQDGRVVDRNTTYTINFRPGD